LAVDCRIASQINSAEIPNTSPTSRETFGFRSAISRDSIAPSSSEMLE
jgi:hypothetical protein